MSELVPTDQFSRRMRELTDNPGVIKAESTVHVHDFYGNLETWHVATFRRDAHEEAFLQRSSASEPLRLYLPADVMAAIVRQRERSIARTRRRGARQALETKREKGIPVGNAAALVKARAARKDPRRRKGARRVGRS